MGVLSNIFGKKKKECSINIHGKETKVVIDSEGNVSTNYSINVMGKELTIPIQTNIDNQIQENEIKEANKTNPQSCEKEPEADEIKVPISFFTTKNVVSIAETCDLFALSMRAKRLGYNYITIKKAIYKEAINNIAKEKRKDYIRQRTTYLNALGIAYEKEGKIEEAITIYEENIKLRAVATHAYNRLIILYRKRKDKENEIRVLKYSLSIFLEENSKRAFRSMENNPDKKEEIQNALITCTKVMGSSGTYCFVPYDDVLNYRNRLQKLTSNI